jgi:hypothetical protein
MKKKVLEGKGCREQQVLAQMVKHSPPKKKMGPSKRVPKPKTQKKKKTLWGMAKTKNQEQKQNKRQKKRPYWVTPKPR